MAKPIASWATMTGVVKTSLSDTMSFDVVSYDYHGIANVTFNITNSSGVRTTTVVSTMTLRTPTDTTAASRYLTKYTNCPASFLAYGVTLNLIDIPDGPITVSAVVTPVSGPTVDLGSIICYNNTHGTYTLPCAVSTVYVSPSGSDANNGLTLGAPLLSIAKAMEVAMGGGGSAGGATIILLAGTHLWARTVAHAAVATTGDHWVTIKGVSSAVVLTRQSDTSTQWLKGANGVRVKLQTLTIKDAYLPVQLASSCSLWVDDCILTTTSGAIHYRLFEYTPHGVGGINATIYATNCSATYVGSAFTGFKLIRDCSAANYLGRAISLPNDTATTAINVASSNQHLDVTGYTPWDPSVEEANVDAADIGGGLVDYTINDYVQDYAAWVDLIGTAIKVRVTGGTIDAAALGDFSLVGVVVVSARITVITLSNPNSVTSTGSATFTLVNFEGTPITNSASLIGTDADTMNDCIFSSIKGLNLTDSHGISLPPTVISTAVVNCFDGVPSTLTSSLPSTLAANMVFVNNTLAGYLTYNSSLTCYTSIVANNIAYAVNVTGSAATFTSKVWTTSNHTFNQADMFGVQASYGNPFIDSAWRTSGILQVANSSSAYESGAAVWKLPAYLLSVGARHVNRGCLSDVTTVVSGSLSGGGGGGGGSSNTYFPSGW